MEFSVLIPVYNVEEYLTECLESVINQSYQDFEVILVDDGSTDKSGKICDEWLNRYPEKVKVIHKQNQGLISARRVGIENANGDFCIFVDSDDFIELNLLETVYSFLEKDDAIDVLIYSFRYYRNGKYAERFHPIASDGEIWKGLKKKELYEKIVFSSDINSLWTKAVRTDVLKSDPTDYTKFFGKNMGEDLLQSLYIITAANVVSYVDRELYNYRINANGISRGFNPEIIAMKNTIHVYQKIQDYLQIWGMNDSETKEKLNARWFNDSMYLMSYCYERATCQAERKTVLSFTWDDMLPGEVRCRRSIYENPNYQCLYLWWKSENWNAIRKYFWRKHIYQSLRVFWRKLKLW